MAKKITYMGDVCERIVALVRNMAVRYNTGLADDRSVASDALPWMRDAHGFARALDEQANPDTLIIGVTAGEARQIVEALRLVTGVQPTTGDPMGQRFTDLADEIEGQLPVEPVDPVLAAAREGLASTYPNLAENVRSGGWDKSTDILVAKAAIAAAMASADLCEKAGWPFAAPKREGK